MLYLKLKDSKSIKIALAAVLLSANPMISYSASPLDPKVLSACKALGYTDDDNFQDCITSGASPEKIAACGYGRRYYAWGYEVNSCIRSGIGVATIQACNKNNYDDVEDLADCLNSRAPAQVIEDCQRVGNGSAERVNNCIGTFKNSSIVGRGDSEKGPDALLAENRQLKKQIKQLQIQISNQSGANCQANVSTNKPINNPVGGDLNDQINRLGAGTTSVPPQSTAAHQEKQPAAR